MIHQDHDYDGNKVQPEAEVVKPFKAPSAIADANKKVTEFFTVRRSVRKTKKEVQEERMRNIEQAIREGREEGLEVGLKLRQLQATVNTILFILTGSRFSKQRSWSGDHTSFPARRICD